MNNPKGVSPVFLHEILHALQTCIGAKPRPVSPRSEECEGIPVVVYLDTTDDTGKRVQARLPVRMWYLLPHLQQVRDKDTGEIIQQERKAEFALCVTLANPEPKPAIPSEPEVKTELPKQIEEVWKDKPAGYRDPESKGSGV